jgi:hypothetical protein
MTVHDRYVPELHLYIPLPLGPLLSDYPLIDVCLLPTGSSTSIRLRPIANSGGQGTTEWFVSSDDGELVALVTLWYESRLFRHMFRCQDPIRLALGKAEAPQIGSFQFPDPAAVLLRGSLMIPVAGSDNYYMEVLSLLWPTRNPTDIQAIHVEPGGLYLEGVLPASFYPGRPSPQVQPVILRVPQDAFDLQVLPWGDSLTVPTSGNSLILIGEDKVGLLHFRVFDLQGALVTDTDENAYRDQTRAIENLKLRIGGLGPSNPPSDDQKRQIVLAVMTIVGRTWTLTDDLTRGCSGTPLTAGDYVKAAATQLADFGAGGPASFLRMVTAEPLGVAVRIAATPHPFEADPTYLHWRADKPGVLMLIGAGTSTTASFVPALLRGKIKRSLQTNLWPSARDWWFSLVDVDPAGRLIGFRDERSGGSSPNVTLLLDESLAPQQLPRTPAPVGSGGDKVVVRSWLCTSTGWLSVDAAPYSPPQPSGDGSDPSRALLGLVDITAMANFLLQGEVFPGLEILAQALQRSDVSVEYKSNGAAESLQFAVTQPQTTVTTGPFWAAAPDPGPDRIPPLWQGTGDPDDNGISEMLVAGQFVTAEPIQPSTGPLRFFARLTSNQEDKTVSFELSADRLTAWHQPAGLPLVRNLARPGSSASVGWLDVDRGLVPFNRTKPAADKPASAMVVFPQFGLPVYPDDDAPRLLPPVGTGASTALPIPISLWLAVGTGRLDHYYLATLPGIELRLASDPLLSWVYRHADPALDQWYSELMRGLPGLPNARAVSDVAWDVSAATTNFAFRLDGAGTSVPAVGWLPPSSASGGTSGHTVVDPAGGCSAVIEPAPKTNLLGPDPKLEIVLSDSAGKQVDVTFRYPTLSVPDLPVALTSGLISTLVPAGANLPAFRVGFNPSSGADGATIVRNGQPLLSGRLADNSVVTVDGLGVVRAEPQGALTRSATPGATADELRWTGGLTLLNNTTSLDLLRCELVNVPLTGESPAEGAGWMCHDGVGGAPMLRGFPLYPLHVTVAGNAQGPYELTVTAVWMRKAPDPPAEQPPDYSRNTIDLKFSQNLGLWTFSVHGTLDWRFDAPPRLDAASETSLARVALSVAMTATSGETWDLTVIEIALDHPVGLLRLPIDGCTAQLDPGQLTLTARSTLTDTPFAYDLEAVVITRTEANRGIVPVDSGQLTWRASGSKDEFRWALIHTLTPASFRTEGDGRLLLAAGVLHDGSRPHAPPAQRAIWQELGARGQSDVASDGIPAAKISALLDRLVARRSLYRPGVWEEDRLDPITRARIAGRDMLSEAGLWHLNVALLRAASSDRIAPPPPWQFVVSSVTTNDVLVDLHADLRSFGPNRFLLIAVPTKDAPPDLPGSWFQRHDPADHGFVVIRFDAPIHVADLGAELWLTLTDRGSDSPPSEPDMTRLAARLVIASNWNADTAPGHYDSTGTVELTGRWVMANQVPYKSGTTGAAALNLRARVYLNRAMATLGGVFGGIGPQDSNVYLFGVARHVVDDPTNNGKEWTWQSPMVLRLRRLDNYLPSASGGSDAGALVVDASGVLWLAPFADGSAPSQPGTSPDVTAAGLNLRLSLPRPEPFDATGGREVRIPWAAGAVLAGRTDLPVVVLQPEPPAREYPEAGIHPRRPAPPDPDARDRVEDLPRSPHAAWLGSEYLGAALWPSALRDLPPGSHPTTPAEGDPFSDLAWLFGVDAGELAAVTVVRQHNPGQSLTLAGARTLLGFPFQLTTDLANNNPQDDTSTVNLQLLLYEGGRFRRVASAEGPADVESARAWGLAELMKRRIRAAGLVVSGYVRLVPVVSPLGVVDEPLAAVRPWDTTKDPSSLPPDPARHLARASPVLRPAPSVALFAYDGQPLAGLRAQCRFFPQDVAPETSIITVPGHGLGDGQEVVYDTTGTPIGGLSKRQTYYVTTATDDTFHLAQTPGGPALSLVASGTDAQLLEGPSADVPSAMLFRLASMGDAAPGHLRPAAGVTVLDDAASQSISRLDRVAFTATELGYPAADQDLNRPRPSVWPPQEDDGSQYLLAPQIDVTSWSSRPGEQVTTQWGATRDEKKNGLIGRVSGNVPSIGLRRPRSAVGAHEYASLTLVGAPRKLLGGQFNVAQWLLSLTLGRTPRPADDEVVDVLTTRRSVHPGLRSPADAQTDSVIVEVEVTNDGVQADAVELAVLAGPDFVPYAEDSSVAIRRTFLLRTSSSHPQPVPDDITGPLDTALAGLIVSEFTAGPSDAAQWASVGGQVARYTGSISIFQQTDAPGSSIVFELSTFDRKVDPVSNVVTWHRTSRGGCLLLSLVPKSSVVPDAPSTASVLAYPKATPEQTQLLGIGRIDPRSFRAAAPEADTAFVWWRSSSDLRAVYRAIPVSGNGSNDEIEFGVRLSGPGGETIPYNDVAVSRRHGPAFRAKVHRKKKS